MADANQTLVCWFAAYCCCPSVAIQSAAGNADYIWRLHAPVSCRCTPSTGTPFLQVSHATAGMELSLEARLSKQHLTNSLQAQVTGTFVSAETGVQAPKMPYRFTASCSASPLQAEGVTLTALFWTHLFAFCGSEQPSTAQWSERLHTAACASKLHRLVCRAGAGHRSLSACFI